MSWKRCQNKLHKLGEVIIYFYKAQNLRMHSLIESFKIVINLIIWQYLKTFQRRKNE